MLWQLIQELHSVWRFCRPSVALKFYWAVLHRFPIILKEKKLFPADNRMRGTIDFNFHGKWMNINLDIYEGRPFAFLREFVGRDVYFREFDFSKLNFEVVIDAGASMGVVTSVFNNLGGGCNKIIAIEAVSFNHPAWNELKATNPNIKLLGKALLDGKPGSEDYLRLLIPGSAPEITTMNEILEDFVISHISFMKLDIEGGEFYVISDDAAWLELVENLAMEVHNQAGSAEKLAQHLLARGFEVRVTDNYGVQVPLAKADYLYASRTGALR